MIGFLVSPIRKDNWEMGHIYVTVKKKSIYRSFQDTLINLKKTKLEIMIMLHLHLFYKLKADNNFAY